MTLPWGTTHRVAWPVMLAPDRDIALRAAQLGWALNISANHGALTFLRRCLRGKGEDGKARTREVNHTPSGGV
jgi:hypothetical protein